MRTIITGCVLTLAAFTWTAAAADAQQKAPQQRGAQAGDIDNRIADYILVRLAERAWVGGDFNVKVSDGTATLTGTVPSEATKARIGRIARQTIGVQELQNNLRVNPAVADAGTQVKDDVLAQRVARRIASQISGAKTGEDWWLEGWRVEGPDNVWNFVVEAENGRVYLEGDVPRLSVIRKAIDAARQTSGVQSVRSDLEIDRVYGGYPYGPYGYGAYPYPYHPYAYDPNYFVYNVDAMPGSASSGGAASARSSSLTGRVTSIDRERGRLTLRTESGTTEFPLSPAALEGVQQGQQVTVHIRLDDGAPSASPSTGQPEERKDTNK